MGLALAKVVDRDHSGWILVRDVMCGAGCTAERRVDGEQVMICRAPQRARELRKRDG